MKKKLLPSGFYDLVFEEALENHNNSNRALGVFLNKGYGLVKTPLIEFEDSLLAHNSLRSVDVISGDNIVLRSDITLQISRILSTRLKDQPLPLRICYCGDVVYAKGQELSRQRQQTQVGIEIIGCDLEESNIEIIENSILSLQELAVDNLLIDLAFPDFLDIFLSKINLANKDDLRGAILRKDISEIKKLAGDYEEIIKKIALKSDDLDSLVADISKYFNQEDIILELARAKKIAEFLKQNFADIEVRFDLFGDHKTSYHDQISFEIFSGRNSVPVARGGRYKMAILDDKIDAIGATIYIDNI